MSSGVNVQSFPYWHECDACYVGALTDAWFDPEVDRHSIGVWCSTCGTQAEVRID